MSEPTTMRRIVVVLIILTAFAMPALADPPATPSLRSVTSVTDDLVQGDVAWVKAQELFDHRDALAWEAPRATDVAAERILETLPAVTFPKLSWNGLVVAYQFEI